MTTHCGTQTIQTSRLTLRQFQLDDAEDMLKYWISHHETQARYRHELCTTIPETKALLTKWLAEYSRNDFYKWAIIETETDRCIGQVFLRNGGNRYEVVYCIGEAFQRKGYMTEALKAIQQYAFTKINLDVLEVFTRSVNVGSQKVIANCGFKHVRTVENALYENGVQVDRYFYELTKSEWLRY